MLSGFSWANYLATSQSSVPQALASPREVLRVDTRSPSFGPDREGAVICRCRVSRGVRTQALCRAGFISPWWRAL